MDWWLQLLGIIIGQINDVVYSCVIMGLIDKILGRDDDGEKTTDTDTGSNNNQRVSVPQRTETLLEHYDITEKQAKAIAEALETHLSDRHSGVSLDTIIEDIESDAGLDRDIASTIARTEYASITTSDRIRQYRDQGRDDDVYKIIVNDCHEICMGARDEIEEHDGVLIDDLEAILRKHAESHPDGTPERMDHWVPHEKCKATITRHVPM